MAVRILLIPRRENPPTIKANKASSSGKPVAHISRTRRKHLEESQRGKYWETCRGNVDYRIPGIPHSTVKKENSNRKETVKNTDSTVRPAPEP